MSKFHCGWTETSVWTFEQCENKWQRMETLKSMAFLLRIIHQQRINRTADAEW